MATNGTKLEQPWVQPGQYQHFKGGLYRVLFVATHSETGEVVVVYSSEQTGELWVRPLSKFTEEVAVGGRATPRFERLREIESRPQESFAPLERRSAGCYSNGRP
ncbi:MAG: DUF1653 domain-containing protein [Rhizomicrobium sp.]